MYRLEIGEVGKSVCSLLRKEYSTTQMIVICISLNMMFKYTLHLISLYFQVCYFYKEIHLKVSVTSLFTYVSLQSSSKEPIFTLHRKFLQ